MKRQRVGRKRLAGSLHEVMYTCTALWKPNRKEREKYSTKLFTCSTAATESPPPMMVMQPFPVAEARVSATANVPCVRPKGNISIKLRFRFGMVADKKREAFVLGPFVNNSPRGALLGCRGSESGRLATPTRKKG